jgi:hypothetical protein
MLHIKWMQQDSFSSFATLAIVHYKAPTISPLNHINHAARVCICGVPQSYEDRQQAALNPI